MVSLDTDRGCVAESGCVSVTVCEAGEAGDTVAASRDRVDLRTSV